ncbi:hypothetical protein FVE85_6163 [Porphyridium purpureum]|uniref:Zinc-finger domain-containing protein n=1 Tax=Porphyridium purpureum TaxID=35688 RepID=A0A5J4Z5T1_PORPP|nr:hypothetical protein FVE85_6163 [Porphyridium purpureum]|eukprot:POR6538..scf295_1
MFGLDEFGEDLAYADSIGWGGEWVEQADNDGLGLGLSDLPAAASPSLRPPHFHGSGTVGALRGGHSYENMQYSAVDQYGRPHYKGLYAVPPSDDLFMDLPHALGAHHAPAHAPQPGGVANAQPHGHGSAPLVSTAPASQPVGTHRGPRLQLDGHGRPHYKGLYALDDVELDEVVGPLHHGSGHPAMTTATTAKRRNVEMSEMTFSTVDHHRPHPSSVVSGVAAPVPHPQQQAHTYGAPNAAALPTQQQQRHHHHHAEAHMNTAEQADNETISSAALTAHGADTLASRVVGGRVEKPKVPRKKPASKPEKAELVKDASVLKELEQLASKPKIRRYSNSTASRFCHICARSMDSVRAISCFNTLFGVCRKIICEKCFEQYGWDWEAASKPGARWSCAHCKGICPERAQCNTYKRTNQRRRLKGLERRKQLEELLIAGGADGISGLLDMREGDEEQS